MNESLLESEDIIISRKGNNFVLKTALKKYGTSVIKSAPVKRKDAEQPVKKISSDCGKIFEIPSIDHTNLKIVFSNSQQTYLPSMLPINRKQNHFYPTLKSPSVRFRKKSPTLF